MPSLDCSVIALETCVGVAVTGTPLNAVGMGTYDMTAIGTCVLWLKAECITGKSDGDDVGSWPDASGNNNDASQGTMAKRPTWEKDEINGFPTVRFDGSDDCMSISWSGTLDVPQYTAMLIMKPAVQGALTTVFEIYDEGSPAGFNLELQSSENPRVVHSDNLGGQTQVLGSGTGVSTSAFSLLTFMSAAADDHEYRVNGTTDTSSSTSRANTLDAACVGRVGCHYDGIAESRFQQMDLTELVLWDGALSDTDRDYAESLLLDKYGIS